MAACAKRCLEFDEPFATAISAASKSFLGRNGDGGLLFAALVADFAAVFKDFDPPTAGILGEVLKDTVDEVIKDLARKVDFASTSPLIAMAGAIMSSKACSISKELRASLSMKIVEGFLRSVPRQSDKKV